MPVPSPCASVDALPGSTRPFPVRAGWDRLRARGTSGPVGRRQRGGRQCALQAFGQLHTQSLPDEVLVAQRHQDRPSGLNKIFYVTQQTKAVISVLAEIVRRVDQNRVPGHPLGDSVFGRGRDVGDDRRRRRRGRWSRSSPGTAVCAGVAPPVCEHTSPAPNSAATAGSPGSAPAQVSLIRSAPAAHASFATLARQVSTLISCSGYCGAQPFDERHDAGGLFVGVHLLAGARLDATDVDDVGAFFDDAVRGGLGGLVGECGAAVVEGIGGAVDDGHDQGAIAGDRLAQERRLHEIQANGPVGADAETAVAAVRGSAPWTLPV